MPYRINLYGGPGIGKSTLAAWLFANLKRNNYHIELVNEWIKSWVWQNITPQGYDQLYVFAKQLRMEELILRRGINIVTDSPLMLQLAYTFRNFPDLYQPISLIIQKFDLAYPSIDILIKRTENIGYQTEGRYHTYEEAEEMDKIIAEQLKTRNIIKMNGPEINKDLVLKLIEDRLSSAN